MHEWESQEQILSALELQDVENFLVYKDFQYQRHEWDNIPVIVPRFIIYLSKYVKGISSFCRHQSEQETTAALRQDFEARFSELRHLIDSRRQEDLGEKGALERTIGRLDLDLRNAEGFIEGF